jgi:FtsH-binding integral membrane protein
MRGMEASWIVIPLIVAAGVCWWWAFFDCLTTSRLDDKQRLNWVLALFFLSIFGAILYWVDKSSPKK